MYLIGAVNSKELKAIKKTGYTIDKIIKPQVFNKLFGNKKVESDSEDMAIVYIDCDICTLLQEWDNENKAKLEKINNSVDEFIKEDLL